MQPPRLEVRKEESKILENHKTVSHIFIDFM
jgi:hypothetical protein